MDVHPTKNVSIGIDPYPYRSVEPRFLDPTPPLSKRRNAKPLRCPKLRDQNKQWITLQGKKSLPGKITLQTKKKHLAKLPPGPTVGQSLAIHSPVATSPVFARSKKALKASARPSWSVTTWRSDCGPRGILGILKQDLTSYSWVLYV